MTDAPTYPIVVVCEAPADQRTASTLADRVLVERIDWIADVLEHIRGYVGLHAAEPFIKWTDMVKRADAHRIYAHGFVEGRPREPEAAMAERALRLVMRTTAIAPAAVLLIRDADKEKRRAAGFEQARGAQAWPFAVVIGVADAKRECWILAGFDPRDDAERDMLAAERRNLGFDPRLTPEVLSATTEGAKHDAKRVLFTLTRGDREREEACLRETALDLLRERGARSGLTAFLDDLEARLVPIFDPSTRR